MGVDSPDYNPSIIGLLGLPDTIYWKTQIVPLFNDVA